ncbi:hypothetical protein FUAX_43840 (plasmid) [Fulvitalea axinellae]|uniref:Outer membrane protein beta-barrel domain-containing protein n=1 Tax=Fulvitalea axinellae TaxID=1182444 RepID=A0AAU9CVH6_9BACT|nr:hypothetical protein FUAX_43840 [Fulvitalea axinellae]
MKIYRFKSIALTGFLALFYAKGFAQKNRVPIQRKLTEIELAKLDYRLNAPHTKDLEGQDNIDDQESDIKSSHQLRFDFKYPFFRSQDNRWIVSPYLGYMSGWYDTEESGTFRLNSLTLGAEMFHRFGTKKYSPIIIANGWTRNSDSIEDFQVGGNLIFMKPLILKKNTSLFIGGLSIYNGFNWLPFLPLVSYATYIGQNTTLQVVLPHKVEVRKYFRKKGYLATGLKIDSDFGIFTKDYLPENFNPGNTLEYRQVFASLYASLNYPLNDFFWINTDLGLTTQFRSYISDDSHGSNEGYFKENSANLYFKVGLAFKPKIGKK